MANTTPTLFSDAAYNNVLSARNEPQCNLAQQATISVPSGTVSGTVIGMIPFETGFSLLDFTLLAGDMDTGTSVTFDVGYAYPAAFGTSTTESLAAFVSASAAAQTGTSIIWPTAGGLLTGVSFVAAQPGYITIRMGGATTTTTASFTMIATFTQDLAST